MKAESPNADSLNYEKWRFAECWLANADLSNVKSPNAHLLNADSLNADSPYADSRKQIRIMPIRRKPIRIMPIHWKLFRRMPIRRILIRRILNRRMSICQIRNRKNIIPYVLFNNEWAMVFCFYSLLLLVFGPIPYLSRMRNKEKKNLCSIFIKIDVTLRRQLHKIYVSERTAAVLLVHHFRWRGT